MLGIDCGDDLTNPPKNKVNNKMTSVAPKNQLYNTLASKYSKAFCLTCNGIALEGLCSPRFLAVWYVERMAYCLEGLVYV